MLNRHDVLAFVVVAVAATNDHGTRLVGEADRLGLLARHHCTSLQGDAQARDVEIQR